MMIRFRCPHCGGPVRVASICAGRKGRCPSCQQTLDIPLAGDAHSDHVPGRTYGDETCHYVMRDVLEVIEGSVVPSGSQGTGFVAQQRSLPLAQALDEARQAFHRPLDLLSNRVWADE